MQQCAQANLHAGKRFAMKGWRIWKKETTPVMHEQCSIRDYTRRRFCLFASLALGLGLVWLVIGWTMTLTPVAQAQGTTITGC